MLAYCVGGGWEKRHRRGWRLRDRAWSLVVGVLVVCALAVVALGCGRVGYQSTLTSEGEASASAGVLPGYDGNCGVPDGTACGGCAGGICQLVTCAGSGFDDCDGNPVSGCETPLDTLEHCGTCGVSCVFANGLASCAAGNCELTGCVPGFGDCDGSAMNGCEAPLDTVTNCGACGSPCSLANGVASCEAGSCELTGCAAGFGDCDGDAMSGCETSLDTLTDCGACGSLCSLANGVASCGGGSCELTGCAAGFGDCDGDAMSGCETSLDTLTDCGACGQLCDIPSATTESCGGGSCTLLACPSSMADCDGDSVTCETSLASLSDCGACDVPCGDGAGRLPHASASCATQACEVGACDAGRLDCDAAATNGCETDGTTLTNCGDCGVPCSVQAGMASCAGGVCSNAGCNAGFGDCDSDSLTCETSLSTLVDCGACNVPCGVGGRLSNASATCSSGTCAIAQCDSGFGDCDGDPSTGCETPLTTNNDCGSCDLTCDGSSECVDGTCQGFEFTPSNVPTSAFEFTGAPSVNFNCGTTTFDSGSLTFSNACGGAQLPTASVVNQTNGGEVALLVFDSFNVSTGSTLRVRGSRPVVLAAAQDVTIAGRLDASASGTTPGAGGHLSCGSSSGTDGSGHGGGGGGGFGTAGASGTNGYGTAGPGGSSRGSGLLTPLQGGCGGGGSAVDRCGTGGAGAGAVQVLAAGELRVTGSVVANGAGGAAACGGGGLGGGSGGGLLLEAARLHVSGQVQATGGSGSPGWTSGSGVGGSGGVGRVHLRGVESCSLVGPVNPPASTDCS